MIKTPLTMKGSGYVLRHKRLRQIVAFLTAFVLVFTCCDLSVLADENPAATHPPGRASAYTGTYDKDCTAFIQRGYVFYIERIPNTHQGEGLSEVSDTSLTGDSELKQSVIDKLWKKYPESWQLSKDMLAENAYFVTIGNYDTTGKIPTLYGDNGVCYKINEKHISYFSSSTSAPSLSINCINDDILLDDENLDMFENGKLTLETLAYYAGRTWGGGNSVSLEDAKQNFIKQFNDIGTLATKLNGNFESLKNANPDKYDAVRVSWILNLLYVINACCGGCYDDYITDFLQYKNQDGSPYFYVPVIVSTIYAFNTASDGPPTFYAMPDWYDKAYSDAYNTDFFNLPPKTDWGNYGNNQQNFENNVFKFYNNGKNTQRTDSIKNKNFYPLRDGHWYNYHDTSNATGWKGQVFTAMPTGPNNQQNGNVGYTYLAYSGGAPTKVKDTLGPFAVTASSNYKIVETGTPVTAFIDIDLSASLDKNRPTERILQDYQNVYDIEAERGYDRADLIINYELSTDKGNGASNPLLDSTHQPENARLTNGNQVVVKELFYNMNGSYDEHNLYSYLCATTAGKTIKVEDKNIIITDSTVNRYIVDVTLKFPDKEYSLVPKGKKVESMKKASDKVDWATKDDPPPDDPDPSVHYYSRIGKPPTPPPENPPVEIPPDTPEIPPDSPENPPTVGGNQMSGIEDNYVEIKEGTPGNEHFEAMAGVPTTEDLYIGFGVTEFMVNLDAKKETSTGGKRIYTYEYNVPNCVGHNIPCEISCPGHEISVGGCGSVSSTGEKCEGGRSEIVYCYDRPETIEEGSYIVSCDCGNSKKGWNDVPEPLYGKGYDEHIASDGKSYISGGGCKHEEHTNAYHKGVVFTGTIEQPIEDFNYLNIYNLDMWRVNELIAELNPKLFSNPNQNWTMDTGFYSFFDQDEYESGNGRLIFKTSTLDNPSGTTNNSSIYGDSKSTCPNASQEYISWEDAAALAEQWANETIGGCKVQAMVVSDYLQLGTTEGYNSIAYHTYTSNEVPITAQAFVAPEFKDNVHAITIGDLTGNEITFSEQPTLQELWGSNPYTAAQWLQTDITRSGYNGYYDVPDLKWNNGNTRNLSKTPLDKYIPEFQSRATKTTQPKAVNKTPKSFSKDGFTNLRTTKAGLDINDIMSTEDRTWPQGSEPRVENGEWDTGHCFIKAKHEISLNTPEGGIDYSDYETKKEVGYTKGKSKVNDIVVHNPVSTQYATVICNDSKYDLRSDASFAAGGDPDVFNNACPGDSTCQHQKLTCPITTPIPHNESCYSTVATQTYHVGGLNEHVHTAACTHQHTIEAGCFDVYGALICTKSDVQYAECTGELNHHLCTSACVVDSRKMLTCSNPHHVAEGQSWDYNSAASHYEYGDSRCWSACGDNSLHSPMLQPVIKDGVELPASDIFINLDREFKVYFPNKGDFAQQPTLHGILNTTNVRGMGYTDGMDCSKWLREKYVKLPVNVIFKDENGNFTKQADIGQVINLNYVPSDGDDTWTFYCVLGNNEQKNSNTLFLSIASNADTRSYYDESSDVTNKDRLDWTYKARHTSHKYQYIDVLGSIGGLAMEDTGDMRFATLFKKEKTDGTWLIKNLIPAVNLKLPNQVVSDNIDVRNETVSVDTQWHDTYGTQYTSAGGKAYKHVDLPLVPKDNPIKALRKEPLRPGYNLYMDVSTIGNYYGENMDENGNWTDKDLYANMQVTPRYWALELNTKTWYPVDVYMGKDGEYTPVAYFDCESHTSEYYLYLDWLEESLRRNYTAKEKAASGEVVDAYTPDDAVKLRTPGTFRDVLGTAQRLFLNDVNRTFIGSTETYGVDRNPEKHLQEATYERQSQRWHWTIGLPSSSVFVKEGKPCTDSNIKEIADMDALIVCTLNIKVRGEVWSLEYDGTAVNNIDGGGIKIFEDGPHANKIYPPPTDPVTGIQLKDPIVTVYHNKMTSADDLRTEGSH